MARLPQFTIRGLLLLTAGIGLILGILLIAMPVFENLYWAVVESSLPVVELAVPFGAGVIGFFVSVHSGETKTAAFLQGVLVTIIFGLLIAMMIPTI